MIKGIVFNVIMVSIMFIAVNIIGAESNTKCGSAKQVLDMRICEVDSVGVLIDAMIQVESSGNDSAYCKRDESVGCLQIRPIMVREVNRVLSMSNDSRRYTMNDRWSRERSVEMFMVIYNRYHLDHSLEMVARCWNGGPNGHKMVATLGYWNKVKKNM